MVLQLWTMTTSPFPWIGPLMLVPIDRTASRGGEQCRRRSRLALGVHQRL